MTELQLQFLVIVTTLTITGTLATPVISTTKSQAACCDIVYYYIELRFVFTSLISRRCLLCLVGLLALPGRASTQQGYPR